ncbi:MAG: transposase [Patescibacteria group bacterium]|nr:transposase [Patescibacteria group bacterium]
MRKRLKTKEQYIYFITVVTHNRKQIFKDEKIRKLWIECLKYCYNKLDFQLYAFCLLYDHYYFLIQPAKKRKIEDVIRHINGIFANQYNKFTNNSGQIVQRKFWDHIIRNEKDFEEKINYIHGNPIKHGIVDDLERWPYSSYYNYYCKHKALIEIDFIQE